MVKFNTNQQVFTNRSEKLEDYTLSDIYGYVSEERLNGLMEEVDRGDIDLSMAYALRDAHLYPQKTLKQFREDMIEKRICDMWKASIVANPHIMKPHMIYSLTSPDELIAEGW